MYRVQIQIPGMDLWANVVGLFDDLFDAIDYAAIRSEHCRIVNEETGEVRWTDA